jgi:hypothetical protein
VRAEGWRSSDDAPRPIPTPSSPPPNGITQAMFTAIVPLVGNEMAAAVQVEGPWQAYLRDMVAAHAAANGRVGIFPYRLHPDALNGTQLGAILGGYQAIAGNAPQAPHDTLQGLRCRELSQALAQFVSGDMNSQLTVFISHTKHSARAEAGDVVALVDLVRNVISTTHLNEFFDAKDLQPGGDWSGGLQQNAAKSALLALRTDLYPSREWCQREVLLAKRNGMPVVILDGLGYAEERGSFLMDHVPRAPIRTSGTEWSRRDVYRGLNILVDECLQRALWKRQHELGKDRLDLMISWWAPHAPEPLTLVNWLEWAKAAGRLPAIEDRLRILHPDPPLGLDERAVLEQILSFGGMSGKLDVMTPRQLASRGG